MQRSELEHAIRASSAIINADAVLILGSQSILATWHETELPMKTTMSDEVDVAPLSDDETEELANAIDGAIGEFSTFHQTHQFYVQGASRKGSILPDGWHNRLVRFHTDNTAGKTGWCLEPHDLCVAKLVAARQKDYAFVDALLQDGKLDLELLIARAQLLEAEAIPEGEIQRRERVISWLDAQKPSG